MRVTGRRLGTVIERILGRRQGKQGLLSAKEIYGQGLLGAPV